MFLFYLRSVLEFLLKRKERERKERRGWERIGKECTNSFHVLEFHKVKGKERNNIRTKEIKYNYILFFKKLEKNDGINPIIKKLMT